jgi:lipopolysaccharide transport system permease protein
MAKWHHFRDVISTLVSRDFKGRYKTTALGMAWSVIGPLLFLVVFYFVFELVLDFGIPRYATFTFTAIVVWTWFQSSLIQAVGSIPANQNLVSQPGFPVATLPIVSVCTNLVNFAISCPLLVGVFLIEGGHPAISLVALPFLIIVQFALTLSLSYIIAAINVTLRDTQYILPVILQLGYYVTPIFYDVSRVPSRYRPLFEFNPMSQLITGYRAVLMYGTMPNWTALIIILLGSLVLLTVGYTYFRRSSYSFLEEL